MLSAKSRPLIEATLPVIAERIPHITPVFYREMFQARPDLMDGMFSRSSQLEGSQPRALAGSITLFAQWLVENPDAYPEAMLSRIAHKHASLGLEEGEYPTVYRYLFGAIAADLGEAATPEIVDAWTEVYWLMADALISLEKDLYARQANESMRSPFRVLRREEAGEDVVVLTFEPADGTPMTPALAGQYVSLFARAQDGLLQPRQFTLLPAEPGQRRLSVRRDPEGEMTPIIHARLREGEVVELSNPYGDLTLDVVEDGGEGPLYLFGAGIGLTPVVSLVEELARRGSEREVVVVAAVRSLDAWPLGEELAAGVRSLENGRLLSFTEETDEGTYRGRVDVGLLEVPAGAGAFLCGPLPFMQDARSQLVDAGVAATAIRYEVFGPDEWLPRS